MAKPDEGPRHAADPEQTPSPGPPASAHEEGIDEIRRPYPPTLLDRFNHFFGRFVGGHGRRKGARDTDPGL